MLVMLPHAQVAEIARTRGLRPDCRRVSSSRRTPRADCTAIGFGSFRTGHIAVTIASNRKGTQGHDPRLLRRLMLAESLLKQGKADLAGRVAFSLTHGPFDSPERRTAATLFASTGTAARGS